MKGEFGEVADKGHNNPRTTILAPNDDKKLPPATAATNTSATTQLSLVGEGE
jgi:hypothetical protein